MYPAGYNIQRRYLMGGKRNDKLIKMVINEVAEDIYCISLYIAYIPQNDVYL